MRIYILMKYFLLAFALCAAPLFSQTLNCNCGENPSSMNEVSGSIGVDVIRPQIDSKANLGFSYGRYLPKSTPVADEVLVNYNFSNNGDNFFHSKFSAHTVSIGTRKHFTLNKSHFTPYVGGGIGETFFTNSGGDPVVHGLYLDLNGGVYYKINKYNSFFVQETVNKIREIPTYTTTSVGYAFSF